MVLVFCLLLIAGIIGGQLLDFSRIHGVLGFITSVCLAYIMVEVGLEFSVDKRKIRVMSGMPLLPLWPPCFPLFYGFYIFSCSCIILGVHRCYLGFLLLRHRQAFFFQ